MLYQILAGRCLRRETDVTVLIPMCPHKTWFTLFDHILVLDATAHLTDYLYQDYTILTPGTWNFVDIVEGYKFYSSIGNLSKTKTAEHREIFLGELYHHVAPSLEAQGFTDPYVVTYKTLNGDSFVEDVQSALGVHVENYGGTRGSNRFRTKDSAVLLGAYRPPLNFEKLAYKLFGASFSACKYAVAHWIQELYRTRIRHHHGEPIKIFVTGEKNMIQSLETVIGRTLLPCVVGGRDDIAQWETTLQKFKYKVQKELYTALVQSRTVHKKSFADAHTGRDVSKVERALRGLLTQRPDLEWHIAEDAAYISLVDKRAPTA